MFLQDFQIGQAYSFQCELVKLYHLGIETAPVFFFENTVLNTPLNLEQLWFYTPLMLVGLKNGL